MTRATLAAFVAGFLALAPGCGTARAAAPEEATVALPALNLSFTIVYVAEDLGFWEKHGVKIGLRDLSGLASINAVIAGSVEFAEVSGLSMTRAAAHGQRLLAIAETLGRPAPQIVLRKSLAQAAGFDPKAPLEERVRALKGRTIGFEGVNSIMDGYLRLLAKRAGLEPQQDITVAVMSATSLVPAFDADRIDGFVETLPWPLKPVLAGTGVMVASGPDGDPPDMMPFANTVFIARPETCAKRERLCQGVGRTLADAASFIASHRDETLRVLEKRFPNFDAKMLAASLAVILRSTPRPPAVDKEGLENTETLNIEAGLMKPDEKLKSYDGLFTDRYLR